MFADRLTLLGVNHKTAPVHVREKLALTSGYEEPLLALKRFEGLKEVYLLSTCNRVELLFVGNKGNGVQQKVLQELFGEVIDDGNCDEYFYIYHDEEAAHHLFHSSCPAWIPWLSERHRYLGR